MGFNSGFKGLNTRTYAHNKLKKVILKLKPSSMLQRNSPSSGRRQDKSKSKVHLITDHEGPDGEYRYSSTLSLTSALGGVAE